MAVKIRLKRMGKKRQPSYRVVVADSRSPRDGRFIEQIGRYDPLQHPSIVEIDNDRALDWLGKGAQPTDAVRKLLQISGAWGTFRGDAAATGEAVPPPTRKKRSKKEKARAAAAAEQADQPAQPAEPEAVAAPEASAAELESAAEAPSAEQAAPEPAAEQETAPEAAAGGGAEPAPEAAAETEPEAAAEAEPEAETGDEPKPEEGS